MIYGAFFNQLLAHPSHWFQFARWHFISQDDDREALPPPRSLLLLPENSTHFLDFLLKTFPSKGATTTISHLTSEQYNVPITNFNELDTALKTLEEWLQNEIPHHLQEGIASSQNRRSFIDKLAKWVGRVTKVAETDYTKKSRCSFFASKVVADIDSLMMFPLGKPKAEHQVLGIGSSQCTTALNHGQQEDKEVQDTRWLEKIHKAVVERSLRDASYRKVCMIDFDGDRLCWKINGEELTPGALGEGMECDVGYRQICKTLSSRITGMPKGYSAYTWPCLEDTDFPIWDDALECFNGAHVEWLRYEVNIDRPRDIFCLDTEIEDDRCFLPSSDDEIPSGQCQIVKNIKTTSDAGGCSSNENTNDEDSIEFKDCGDDNKSNNSLDSDSIYNSPHDFPLTTQNRRPRVHTRNMLKKRKREKGKHGDDNDRSI
jgi:hypothetical protein